MPAPFCIYPIRIIRAVIRKSRRVRGFFGFGSCAKVFIFYFLEGCCGLRGSMECRRERCVKVEEKGIGSERLFFYFGCKMNFILLLILGYKTISI